MDGMDHNIETPSDAGRVSLSESAITAIAEAVAALNAASVPIKPPSLNTRLAAIRSEAFGIGKDDIEMKSKDGKKWNIKGHTVEAVLSEMRPLLDKYKVGLTPNLVERTYSGNRCDVLVDFEFQSLDQPDDTRVIRWAGAGTDNGDKAFAKACTNALKEVLKKLFLVTDRDDAKEETESVSYQTESAAASAKIEEQREQARKAVELWARNFKVALESAQSQKQVSRLMRENKSTLDGEHTPVVTRDFFLDLAKRRKIELPEDIDE